MINKPSDVDVFASAAISHKEAGREKDASAYQGPTTLLKHQIKRSKRKPSNGNEDTGAGSSINKD